MSTTSTSSTSSSSTTTTNYSRITGLSSGLDIDSMVSSLMKAARVPLDKLEQKKQTLEWQQEDYRTLNTALYNFKTTASDTRLERTFLARDAASSNESAATATAAANATDGTYNIKVNQLATGVSKASTAALTSGKNSSGNSLTLFDQFTEFGSRGYSSTDDITVTINGTALTFDLDVDNLTTVASKINEADLGVAASYDSTRNRFFLNSDSTGSAAETTITDSANLFSTGTNNSILKLNIDDGVSYKGQNASIDFGDATGLESSTNAITVNGITLNLKSADISKNSTTITVTRDVDAVVASITKFIDSYNTTLKTLYDKLTEERDPDYPPLTDAQKDEMSDSDITKWEEKAKSGLLRNDTMLKNVISNLRTTVTGVVKGIGAYTSLSSIGIASESYDTNGQMVIDEDALREALAADPDAVKELFANSSTVSSQKGIAVKLYTTTVNGISYLADKAGSDSTTSTVDSSYIGKQLTKLSDEIDDWETKLDKKEDKYYAKFSSMEQTIYLMNTQTSWLTSMLSS